MDKQQIFNELCEHSSRDDCVDRRAFIQFLQANGYCFPGHLTEAFFRRFNFEKEDTLTFDQFSLALLQLSAAHQAAGRLAAGSQDQYNQSQNINVRKPKALTYHQAVALLLSFLNVFYQ